MFKVNAALTNRAILRSGGEATGRVYQIQIDPEDLPGNVDALIADRLYEDRDVCEGVLDEDGNVVPHVINGEPVLLTVDGIEIDDLVRAVREDQAAIEEAIAESARKTKSAA